MFSNTYTSLPPAKTMRKLLFLVLILCTFSFQQLSAQAILVTGTSFNPTPGNESRTYIGLNDIIHYGVQRGSITATPVIAPNVNADVFNPNYYHAITDNPYKLDNTRYTNLGTPDYQFVYGTKPAGGNTNILEYVVKGLQPSSAVSVLVEYCSVISPSYTTCGSGERTEFKGGINLDASNQLNGSDATQLSAGQCATYTFNGTVAANGDMIFRMNATRNGTCQAIGIKRIEVTGIIKPVIISDMGTEVCVGEQISVQTTQIYNNSTYQWQINTGSGWSNISGATNQTLLYDVLTAGNYQFRLNVTPISSGVAVTTDPVSVSAITCCTISGVAASRQTVFYDNFGRLNTAVTAGTSYYTWDYSNVLAPVEVLNTTATPFRWPLTPAPLSATFSGGPGPLNDGQYAVAAYLTGYNYPVNGFNGARLEWANRVKGLNTIPNPDISYDHSGLPEGGALFLNCPPSTFGSTLYTRTINSLCSGKQLYFECWIAVFTNSASGAYNPVNVQVRLTEVGNPGNVVTASGTATREADGGGVWVRVAASITLTTGSAIQMDLINNINASANGNDLVLDDIKIMACSPPSLNLYFDLPSLLEATTVCPANGTITLITQATTLLETFYGGAPRYMFQWSRTPNDLTSWTNLGAPGTAESMSYSSLSSHPSFSGLADGGKVYYRIIAATSSTFTSRSNFTGVNYANPNDPCKNYTVSAPIEATALCPLPVNLLQFTGWKNGNANQLNWSTSSEENNDYFIVERSSDGITFTEIGRVDGSGNSASIQQYNYEDLRPLSGTNYYRLQQVDFDGKASYSNIVLLDNGSTAATMDIYPNPNNGSFDIRISSEMTDSYVLETMDIHGKIVYSTTGDQAYETFQVSNLSSGVYVVRLSSGNQVITKKLVVY
jgi:hypothetical protein